MKNDREARTAEMFHITEQCEKLERELLAIPGVVEAEFSLDGFYDNLNQVIFLTKYNIKPTGWNYFQAKRELLDAVIRVAGENDLSPSGDAIEDYGEHYYFVFHCGSNWRRCESAGGAETAE